MKWLINIFILFFALTSQADLPDIIAFVNDEPITKYDFESRSKLVAGLNKLDLSNLEIKAKLNYETLRSLIDDKLISQYVKKKGIKISEKDIDKAIILFEQRNKMQPGDMQKHLISQELDIQAFRTQIKSEISKESIFRSVFNAVIVSQSEIDLLTMDNAPNFNVEAWVFTSKEGNIEAKRSMQLLRKRLSDCNKLDKKLFARFADAEKFDRKLSNFPPKIKSIVTDTEVGRASEIYKENDQYKMIFVCQKVANLSDEELNNVKLFLTNKKMSDQAKKLLRNLKRAANIKILAYF